MLLINLDESKKQCCQVFLFISALWLLIGCKKNLEDVRKVEESFIDLYLARGAKHFPDSERSLESCKKEKDQDCLRVYNSFVNARSYLLSLPKDKMLDQIFDTITQKNCKKSEQDYGVQATCYGALMFLVFYDTPAEDREILARADHLSDQMKTFLLSSPQMAWVYNRPNKKQWLQLAREDGISWSDEITEGIFFDVMMEKTTASHFWITAPNIE